MAKYHSKLWDAVKFEVLNASGSDDELVDEALLTIRSIATSLAHGLQDIPQRDSPLSRYLKPIIKECSELLLEPQQKQAKPAGQILASILRAGPVPRAYIIRDTLPTLLTIYDEAEGIIKQRAMLEVLNHIFESAVLGYGDCGSLEVYPTLGIPLAEFKDRLFDIYSKALMSTNKDEVGFRIVALKGLGALCGIQKLFTDSEVGMVVQYLDEIVLEKEEEAREETRYVFLILQSSRKANGIDYKSEEKH